VRSLSCCGRQQSGGQHGRHLRVGRLSGRPAGGDVGGRGQLARGDVRAPPAPAPHQVRDALRRAAAWPREVEVPASKQPVCLRLLRWSDGWR